MTPANLEPAASALTTNADVYFPPTRSFTSGLPAETVEDIATCLRQNDAGGLRQACMLLHHSQSGHDERTYLEETTSGAKTNGLATLVALTAVPCVARSVRKIIVNVSGPRRGDDLLETMLQTKQVALGWHVKITMPWVDLGGDQPAIEQMAELALSRILENLNLTKAKPSFLIAYDQGWEQSLSNDASTLEDRNCGLLLAAFLSACAKAEYRVGSLEVFGDAGCVPLDPASPLGRGDFPAYASLKHLDLDLHQRDATQPPHTVLGLLEAARNLETFKLRWNLRPATSGPNALKPLKTATTRSHGIRDIALHGISGSATDFVDVLKRFKTLRKEKLARLELSDCCLTGDSENVDEVLEYVGKAFELKEIRLRFLCGKGAGVWSVGGEGRQEVKALVERVGEKGRFVKQRAGKKRKR